MAMTSTLNQYTFGQQLTATISNYPIYSIPCRYYHSGCYYGNNCHYVHMDYTKAPPKLSSTAQQTELLSTEMKEIKQQIRAIYNILNDDHKISLQTLETSSVSSILSTSTTSSKRSKRKRKKKKNKNLAQQQNFGNQRIIAHSNITTLNNKILSDDDNTTTPPPQIPSPSTTHPQLKVITTLNDKTLSGNNNKTIPHPKPTTAPTTFDDHKKSPQHEPTAMISDTEQKIDDEYAALIMMLKQKEKEATNYNVKGNKYFNDKNYENAVLYFKKAVALVPDNFLYHTNLSSAYFKSKQLSLALEHAQIGTQLSNEQYAPAMLRLAFAAYELHEWEKALYAFIEYKELLTNGDPDKKKYDKFIAACTTKLYK